MLFPIQNNILVTHEISGLGVTEGAIRQDRNNSHLGKITEVLGEHWNDKGIAEVAFSLGGGVKPGSMEEFDNTG